MKLRRVFLPLAALVLVVSLSGAKACTPAPKAAPAQTVNCAKILAQLPPGSTCHKIASD